MKKYRYWALVYLQIVFKVFSGNDEFLHSFACEDLQA